MTYHIRATGISIIIHVLLVAAVVSAGSLMQKPCLPMVISFDIAKAGIAEVNLAAPPSPPLRKPCPIKTTKPVQEVKEKIIQEELPRPSIVSEVPMPLPAPQPVNEQLAFVSHQETGNPGLTGNKAGNGSGSGDQDWEQSAQERYLREHFLYIKDRILSRIIYPNLARRMGWHGKVLTSFIIHLDGTVTDVRILSSSGFKVLDENAVTTIKDVSPFPKPPITAKIIIPISYRLRPG